MALRRYIYLVIVHFSTERAVAGLEHRPVIYSLGSCHGPNGCILVHVEDAGNFVVEAYNLEDDQIHDEDNDGDGDHLRRSEHEACLQGADDTDATFHGRQGGQEVGEEEKHCALVKDMDLGANKNN